MEAEQSTPIYKEPSFKYRNPFHSRLPIFDCKLEILKKINESDVVIIQGSTGRFLSSKTR